MTIFLVSIPISHSRNTAVVNYPRGPNLTPTTERDKNIFLSLRIESVCLRSRCTVMTAEFTQHFRRTSVGPRVLEKSGELPGGNGDRRLVDRVLDPAALNPARRAITVPNMSVSTTSDNLKDPSFQTGVRTHFQKFQSVG